MPEAKVSERKKAAVASGGEANKMNKQYRQRPHTAIGDAIAECVSGGLSVIPIGNDKRPNWAMLPRDAHGKPTWAPFMREAADVDTRTQWAMSGNRGDLQAIAVVGGAVSGGLLIFDFDVPSYYEVWKQAVGADADGLPVQRTGGGGYQTFMLCPAPGGNLKLAWAEDDGEESGRTIAIETRGEGGYAVVAPSIHPSGKYYEMLSGSLADIPVITQDRADRLIAAARELDEMPRTRQQMESLQARACETLRDNRTKQVREGSVIDAYNAAHAIEEMLGKHGYVRGSSDRYIRPGGNSSSVSVLDGRSCHWSTNDPLNDGKLNDGMGVHDSFSIFCELEHHGEITNAVRAAAEELGMEFRATSGDHQEVEIPTGIDSDPILITLHFGFSDKKESFKGRITARWNDSPLHEDRVDLCSDLSRKRFQKAVGRKILASGGVTGDADVDSIAAEIESALLAKLETLREALSSQSEAPAGVDHQALLAEMPDEARADAEEMLFDPKLIPRLLADVRAIGIAGETTNAATVYLVATSRVLERPVSAIITGHTSTGKSFISDRVSKLFPPEAVIPATQMTTQALYHMPPGSLQHRWIIGGERSRLENDETAEASRAMREMKSAGRLSKLMPVKGPNGIETVLIEQEGPIAHTESTTMAMAEIFGEDSNRCLMLSTDDTEPQTRRILKAHAASRSMPDVDREKLIQKHYAIQRMIALAPARVDIPFVDRLADLFPTRRPEARRAFEQLLSMIEVIALFHFRQRQTDDQGRIVATRRDYYLARQLLSGPLSRSIGGVISDGAKRFANRLLAWARTITFSSTDVYAHEDFSPNHVRGLLRELVQCGFLKVEEQGRPGKAWQYRIARAVPADANGNAFTIGGDDTLLPSVDDVFGK